MMVGLRGSQVAGFEVYARQVYGWAYRLLGRHHDALDVVQDVFIRWDRQCGESEPAQPLGWLRRATVNRAIDVQRQRGAGVSRLEGQVFAGSAPTCGMPGQDLAVLRSDIVAALSELTDMQRGVLVAKVYDEKTFAQIAEELDVAVPTVKTHYLRAVRAVRDRLERRWGEEVGS